MKKVLLAGVDFYQRKISPNKKSCCRFIPTCSEYARIAIETYGAAYGTVLAAKRIARCQPFCKGGYDPVPEKKDIVVRRDQNQ